MNAPKFPNKYPTREFLVKWLEEDGIPMSSYSLKEVLKENPDFIDNALEEIYENPPENFWAAYQYHRNKKLAGVTVPIFSEPSNPSSASRP